MAKQTSLFLTVNGRLEGVNFIGTGSGILNQSIFTPGSDGSLVKAVNLTTTNPTAVTVQLYLNKDATRVLLGTVVLPGLSGTDGAALPVNILDRSIIPAIPLDNAGNTILHVPHGTTLEINITNLDSTQILGAAILAENF